MTAVLRGRGLQAADVDDIVQEVAVRALRTGRRFESEEHLVAWCCRVGINLHIDSTRRQRRLTGEPPPEPVAGHDTAVTVEQRLALEVLAGGIAELSDDERRLLFELEQAGSRRESVRLAVRRHRLRARLAALVEGMTAGVAVVRRWPRLARPLSRPAKVSLAAAPVVAIGLVLGPLIPAGRPVQTPDQSTRNEVPLVDTVPAPSVPDRELRTPAEMPPAVPAARASEPAARPSTTAAGPVTVVDVAPAGVPVRVSAEERPNDREPLFCTGGLVDVCVPRPPGVPEHTLPSLP